MVTGSAVDEREDEEWDSRERLFLRRVSGDDWLEDCEDDEEDEPVTGAEVDPDPDSLPAFEGVCAEDEFGSELLELGELGDEDCDCEADWSVFVLVSGEVPGVPVCDESFG